MNAKEISEELERVAKNLLEDLHPEAAETLQEIHFEPHAVSYVYLTDDGTKRANSFNFRPGEYFDEQTR